LLSKLKNKIMKISKKIFLGALLVLSSLTLNAQEITVADCTDSSGTAVTDTAAKIVTKAAAKAVAKNVVKQLIKSKKMSEGESAAEAEDAATDVSEVLEDETAEAAGDAVGEVAAEMGMEASLELATDPTPVGLASVAVSAAITAIWTAFKDNVKGNPKPIYIDIEKAKNGGYILNLPDTKHLSVLALPKAYDSPRIILNHSNDGWWKALVKFKQTDPTYWEEIVCVTSGKTTSANYLNPDLATDYIVTISYAKDWGAHTNMYSIRNLENFDRDHDWYFIWLKGS